MTGEESSRILSELAQVDQLSDPNVLVLLKQYLQLGGNEDEAKKILLKNYVGYEAACSKLCKWLEKLKGDGGKAANDAVFDCLEKMIVKHFNAKTADVKFVETGIAPNWLEDMLADSAWSGVLRNLSDETKENSALLDYAKRRLTMMVDTPNKGASAANGPSSLDTNALHDPVNFIRLLHAALQKVADANSDIEVQTELHRLAKFACFDERSFFFTLRVLYEVGEQTGEQKRITVRRVCHELQRESMEQATKEIDGKIFSLKVAIFLESIISGVTLPKEVMDGLKEVLTVEPAIETLATLLDHLKGNKAQGREVQIFHQPEVLERFLHALYIPGGVGARETRAREILSEIIAMCCTRDAGSSEVLMKSLLGTSDICSRHPSGVPRSALQKRVVDPLSKELDHAPIAAGVLVWIRHGLIQNPKPMDLKVVVPYYLHLSTKIAEMHPLLREDCLKVSGEAFQYKYSDLDELTTLDIRKIYVEHLVDLSQLGIALPILDLVNKWSSTDISFTRNFVKQLLAIAGPPYTDAFRDAFLRLIAKPDTATSIGNDREAVTLLKRFVGESGDNVILPEPISDLVA